MAKSRYKKFWLSAIALVAVIATGIWLATPPKPKLYQGRTIREWVSRINNHVDYAKQRDEANWAIVQIGTNALPDLERILAWRPDSWREVLERYAVKFRLKKPGPGVNELYKLENSACEAAYNLAENKTDISRLIPHLRYHFTNGTYADSSGARALAQAGPQGIATLTNLLFTGSRNVRDKCGWALGMVSRKPEAYTALIQSAKIENDPTIRANALLYLDRSHAPAEQVVPLGIKFFHSDSGDIGYQQWAALSLLQHYRDLPEVKAVFEEALTNSNVRVRSIVDRVLGVEKPKARTP